MSEKSKGYILLAAIWSLMAGVGVGIKLKDKEESWIHAGFCAANVIICLIRAYVINKND